jgi:hypothetical protein
MKLAIRIATLALVVAGAVAGNSLPKTSTLAAIHQGNSPGPTPTCNPFTQNCASIR